MKLHIASTTSTTRRDIAVTVIVLLLLSCIRKNALVAVDASPPPFFGSRISQSILRRFRIRGTCHTTFTLKRPNEEAIHRMFDTGGSSLRFNHNFVGVTNPSLHALHSQLASEEVTPTRYSSSFITNTTASCDEEQPWLSDAFPKTHLSKQKGWRLIRIRRKIGQGEECYRTVRDAILGWERMHERSTWASIRLLNYERSSNYRDQKSRYSLPSNVMQIGSGGYCLGEKKLVTISKSPMGVWSMNPCMVVYDLVDERDTSGKGGMTYSATAYGTLNGHLLSGEERVSVGIRDGRDRDVEVEVLSYSHATPGFLGRMVFPMITGMQKRFFQEQVDTLERIANECSTSVQNGSHQENSNHWAGSDGSSFPIDRFSFSDEGSNKGKVMYTQSN
eukprot:CAMPEP_0195525722 /NCGR_PEP_ID=MMETSP0794_2-20130614/26309_1 /TAXON_ID=515487 /ORGANISM="Stephanopyxis turris, Strain CCMP 815" /LENGTH=389 /DNA_ID=CAMNT_0040656241 /DNA_START=45 /DNA_END=1214 /DNA_ORIENTATION=+